MKTDLAMPGPRAMAWADELARRLGVEDAEFLLSNRAEWTGIRPRGRLSAGGSCRLVQAADGWMAVNLARRSDVESLGAVLEADLGDQDPWAAIEHHSGTARAGEMVERCQLLGVPAAVLDDPDVSSADAVTIHGVGDPLVRSNAPKVVDLSSMWAGPLCAHLLGRNGMEVLKVESAERPDGARFGNTDFYDWLHGGHGEAVLDLGSPEGRDELTALLQEADLVIEASRPRALRQLGVDAAGLLADRKGKVWISITGYGRSGPRDNWIAFGDDAAVAGGLVSDSETGPGFIGDAIADPLTGLVAAAAALDSWSSGGGVLLEVRMAAVARRFAELDRV